MNWLLIGGGGREAAIAWKLSQSDHIHRIFVAPGLGKLYEKCENTGISPDNFEELLRFSKENDVKMVVVGPELPLVMGIQDVFRAEGISVFGPDRECARLEGSKRFAKEFMLKHGISTATYEAFTDAESAKRKLSEVFYPAVIKADGLCAGKGVIIAENYEAAREAVEDILVRKKFGEEGKELVIEEFLTGTEASLLCFVSHNKIYPMQSAKDYKRIFEDDEGLNTGGVGCFSPSPLFTPKLWAHLYSDVLRPIEVGLNAEKMDFTGILFIGLMIENDIPKVLEFNVRFGDPETEVLLPRLDSDLAVLMMKTIDGTIKEEDIQWRGEESVAVILTAEGYPEEYRKGDEITLDESQLKDILLFHNGTKEVDGKYYTNGGRVLSVVALGKTRAEAREKIYAAIDGIHFSGMKYRRDIAL